MRDEIIKELNRATGRVGFYYKNLITGEEIGLNENDTFEAASVIKLPIFAEISRRDALKTADMTERIIVRNSEKMPSCGALNSFTDEPSIDIRTLCNLMITISDNTATNLLMKQFGIEELNAGFSEIGFGKTRINRLLFDAEAARQGKENVFVPKEIGSLLEKIYRKEFVDAAVSEKITETLLAQQIKHKIPKRLPNGIKVAHKTGDDAGISNDVGIVYAKEPFVIAFASNKTDVPVFDQIIRDVSYRCCKLG